MVKARAFWVSEPGRGEIREHSLTGLGPQEAQVETLFSGVSRGTEALVFTGRVPEGQHKTMRAPFQEGDFPAPVKYGYSVVGRVRKGAPDLDGRAVYCLYPHQTCFNIAAEALVPVPDDVPPARAILAANMETALNAVWDAAPASDAAVTVIGAGTVGCLTAYLLARLARLEPELVDRNPARETVAQALGLRFATPDHALGDRDLIVHASGNGEGLIRALALCAFEATILELSWYGADPVILPLGEDFHAKRLTLRSSQVGSVAPSRRDRVSRRDRLAMALALLDDPALDVLISGESRFEALPELMLALARPCGDALCHRIVYQD